MQRKGYKTSGNTSFDCRTSPKLSQFWGVTLLSRKTQSQLKPGYIDDTGSQKSVQCWHSNSKTAASAGGRVSFCRIRLTSTVSTVSTSRSASPSLGSACAFSNVRELQRARYSTKPASRARSARWSSINGGKSVRDTGSAGKQKRNANFTAKRKQISPASPKSKILRSEAPSASKVTEQSAGA